jgi:hypothetical protein
MRVIHLLRSLNLLIVSANADYCQHNRALR